MKKYTKAIAGAMALVSAVTAFSGCSGSGTPAASGATSSSTASTTGETQKQMSENEGVQSAVGNVSAAIRTSRLTQRSSGWPGGTFRKRLPQ